MSSESPPTNRCPLCGESNDCAMARAGGRVADCWCPPERFPAELLAKAEPGACICRACLGKASAEAPAG